MKTHLLCLLFFLITINFNLNAQSLIINANNSPSQLVQNGFVGPGVSVSNISGSLGSISSATFSNNGITNFPFSDGLLMTTGEVTMMNSPQSYFMSTSLNMPGEPVLNALVAPMTTFDAQVLNFDFAAAGDSVEFDFIFSSEEYNDYVNTNFNDVFGFFVTGPGYSPNTNVALIPGTATPIAINSVNNGGPYGQAASGPCTNCSYYIDNVAQPHYYPLAPDGLTTAINIRFAVQPCATYSFKIAIADVGDGVFDSQVFLKQGSFIPCSNPRISAAGIPVINQQTIELCAGDSIELSLPDAPQYAWSNGATTQSIIVSQAGTYSAMMSGGQCFVATDNVDVIVHNPLPVASISFLNDTLVSNYNTNGYTFAWTLNGLPVTGSQNSLPVNGPGCYKLIVTDSVGCAIESNEWCTTTGLAEFEIVETQAFPNPVSDIAYVSTNFIAGSTTTINIYDAVGSLIQVQTVSGSTHTPVDVQSLADGVYYLEISNNKSAGKLKSKVAVMH